MDFAKFVHLISTKRLHFTRIDKFDDKFEGSYPVQNLEEWKGIYPEIGDFSHYRKFAVVSCWYTSGNESAAMWELYSKNYQGISILTTKQKLESSIKDDFVKYEPVKYIDFMRKKAKILIPLDVFLYKRIEFMHEREFRAFQFSIPQSDGIEDGFPNFGSPEKQGGYPKEGIDIPIDLTKLIEKIVLSPYSQKWFKNIVKKILLEHNLSNLKVCDSELTSDPLYPIQ